MKNLPPGKCKLMNPFSPLSLGASFKTLSLVLHRPLTGFLYPAPFSLKQHFPLPLVLNCSFLCSQTPFFLLSTIYSLLQKKLPHIFFLHPSSPVTASTLFHFFKTTQEYSIICVIGSFLLQQNHCDSITASLEATRDSLRALHLEK